MPCPRCREQSSRLRLALRGLKIARSVLDYVSLDKWEREVTEKDRKAFDKICEQLLD